MVVLVVVVVIVIGDRCWWWRWWWCVWPLLAPPVIVVGGGASGGAGGRYWCWRRFRWCWRSLLALLVYQCMAAVSTMPMPPLPPTALQPRVNGNTGVRLPPSGCLVAWLAAWLALWLCRCAVHDGSICTRRHA